MPFPYILDRLANLRPKAAAVPASALPEFGKRLIDFDREYRAFTSLYAADQFDYVQWGKVVDAFAELQPRRDPYTGGLE